MTLTVRTDHRVSEALAQYCAQAGQTKSDVVKLALAEFLAKQALPKTTVWDSVKDLVLALEADSTDAPPTSLAPVKQARDRKKHLSDYYAQRHDKRRAHRRGPADRAV
jgi:antitoxin component of RelBE/YafQ-DinJ toxin-antitoxin module